MAKIYEITTRTIPPLRDRYPLVETENMPEKYQTVPISYKSDEIEKFDVILFHRLMIRNYGDPSEMEIEPKSETLRELVKGTYVVKRIEGGYKASFPSLSYADFEKAGIRNARIPATSAEWRYFAFTKSGGIIQVGTENKHTGMLICHVLSEKQKKPSERIIKESEKFINDLLKEAQRLKGQILNPKKEFEEGEGVQLYLLHNVYLYNYGSAELMLDSAEEKEQKLSYECLKYDARTEDWKDPEKRAYALKFMLGLGMYYAASISYYFMALEGFVNLIYHAFLRDEFRDRELNLDQRLDLEQKIRLMTRLCYGFKDEHIDHKSEIFQNFKRLKNFRNQIFHSRIEDSLKAVTLFESGFLYTCKMDKDRKQLFPAHKINLKKEDVLTIKSIVDEIIKEILSTMKEKFKKLTDEFIMENKISNEVSFWIDETEKIMLGSTKNKSVFNKN